MKKIILAICVFCSITSHAGSNFNTDTGEQRMCVSGSFLKKSKVLLDISESYKELQKTSSNSFEATSYAALASVALEQKDHLDDLYRNYLENAAPGNSLASECYK